MRSNPLLQAASKDSPKIRRRLTSVSYDHETFNPDFADIQMNQWVIYLGFASTALFDIIIAGMMCFVLYKNRLNIGISHISRHSNRLLLNLITYALAAGLVTTWVMIFSTKRRSEASYCSFAAILGIVLVSLKQYSNPTSAWLPASVPRASRYPSIFFRDVFNNKMWAPDHLPYVL